MSDSPTTGLPCFLVEWYGPGVCVEQLERTTSLLSDSRNAVELIMGLAVPADEVAFAVVVADSEEAVRQACRDVGTPAQRVSDAVRTWLLPGNE